LDALHQAADLLFGQLGIDVQQAHRVERAVPLPLEGINVGRRAHEVVLLVVPIRRAGEAVGLEHSAGVLDERTV